MVLASGTGTLLRSLLDAATGDFPARIVAVGTDRPCPALDIAADAQLPSYMVRLGDYDSREQWDAAIAEATAVHRPDLVVSAGFMKILGPQFLSQFLGRVINTHPALLPSFPGAHAVPEPWRMASRSPAAPCIWSTRGWTPGRSLPSRPSR